MIELWVSSQRFDVSFDWIKLSLMTDLLCVSMTEKTGQCSTFFTDFSSIFRSNADSQVLIKKCLF